MSLMVRATVPDRGVSATLDVAPGETVALLGPNGAGKSTLLAIAAGLLRPDSGEVVLAGRTLLDTDRGIDVPPHRRAVAMLAQEPLLFPHLTVLENVAFGPRSRRRTRSQARDLALGWLDQVDLRDLATRRPGQLSGGQAQRVAIARALAAEPDLLLLDEPMAALDVAVAPALRQVLRRVLAERTTLLVTHDVLDALLIADRVIVVDDGRIVEDGPSREVLSHPRSSFAAQLAGLNLLTGRWNGRSVDLPDGTSVHGIVVGPPPAVGEQVVATFRPHSVAVYVDRTTGSPRNSFPRVVTDLEPVGELIRVRSAQISADITAPAIAELHLTPGTPVRFTVKATEVAVYRL